MPCKATDMHFIDDALRGRAVKRSITFPVVSVDLYDNAFHRRRGVVAGSGRRLTIVIWRHGYSSTIGVQQNFFGIKTQTTGGLGRPVNPIGVDLSWFDSRH